MTAAEDAYSVDGSRRGTFILTACRELLDTHPESERIREQVDAVEQAMPDRPGIVVSFCRALVETTCKTILLDRGAVVDDRWEAPKLLAEVKKYVNLGPSPDGTVDKKLRSGTESLSSGLSQLVTGIVEIRNAHGTAAHGADAYAPLLDSGYAEILARATDAVVGLLFKIHLRGARRQPLVRLRYGDHPDFDESIDQSFGPFEVVEVPLLASEALYRTDFEAYRLALNQFLQEREETAAQLDGRADAEDEDRETS